MSRTERTWFTHGHRQTAADSVRRAVPDERQLRDFLDLGIFLREKAGAGAIAAEWWKSCPQPLTFLDASYATFARIREHPVPDGLVARREEVPGLLERNQRMKELRDLFRGGITESWRHLWIPPRLRYYRSTATDGREPTKVLVFTGWRFVPRAIAGVLSAEVERDLGIGAGALPRTHGLAVSGKRSGAAPVLDLCYPSRLLARIIDPLHGATEGREPVVIVDAAREALAQALQHEHGVRLVERGGLPRWQLLARVEGHIPSGINRVLREHQRPGIGNASAWLLGKMRRWADREAELAISKKELDRLAEVASFSPAVSAVRALRRVRSHAIDEEDHALLAWVGLEVLRNYFGRPITQRVIDATVTSERGRGYPDRVLHYCREGQIQAVLDEYLHLAAESNSRRHPLVALGDVLSMGTGFTTINVRRSDGRLSRRPQPIRAHVALAFGEDVRDERPPGRGSLNDGPSRR